MKSSAESYVNSIPSTDVEMAQKTWTISSFESGIWFLDFQRNENFIYWSSFLKMG